MQKSSRNTAKATCILVIHSFIQFAYKINLIDQAKAPKKLVWRKNCEGVLKGCSAKCSKIGHGSKVKVFLPYHSVNASVWLNIMKKIYGKLFCKMCKV